MIKEHMKKLSADYQEVLNMNIQLQTDLMKINDELAMVLGWQ